MNPPTLVHAQSIIQKADRELGTAHRHDGKDSAGIGILTNVVSNAWSMDGRNYFEVFCNLNRTQQSCMSPKTIVNCMTYCKAFRNGENLFISV
jgi:hypothetical protein